MLRERVVQVGALRDQEAPMWTPAEGKKTEIRTVYDDAGCVNSQCADDCDDVLTAVRMLFIFPGT